MHMHEEPGAEEEAKEELRLNFRSPGISGRQDETEKKLPQFVEIQSSPSPRVSSLK